MSAIGKGSQFRIGHADEQHKVHMAVRPIQARIKAVRPQASTACAFAPALKSCWMQSALGCRAAQGPMAAMVTWPGLARTVSMMQWTACWSTSAKAGFVPYPFSYAAYLLSGFPGQRSRPPLSWPRPVFQHSRRRLGRWRGRRHRTLALAAQHEQAHQYQRDGQHNAANHGPETQPGQGCLLYTSDAADEL